MSQQYWNKFCYGLPDLFRRPCGSAIWGACMVPTYTAVYTSMEQAPSVHMQYPHGIQPIPSYT